MTMSTFDALKHALAAVQTVLSLTVESDDPEETQTRERLRETNEVLLKLLNRIALAATFSTVASDAGFSSVAVEQMQELISSPEKLDKLVTEAERYEARMVAAGVDPRACRERIDRAVKAGDKAAAQVVFAEIREKIRAHEAK